MAAKEFQRNTRQRQVILEELQKLTSHPTAATLYEIVRRRLPKVSLGTVYRNLDLLTQMGMVGKLEFSGGEARFDGDLACHDHVRCVRCGRLDDVQGEPLDLPEKQYQNCDGYEIVGHRLELLGICAACQSDPAADLPEKRPADH